MTQPGYPAAHRRFAGSAAAAFVMQSLGLLLAWGIQVALARMLPRSDFGVFVTVSALTATLAAPAGLDAAYDGGAIKLPPEPKDAKAPPFKWSADMSLTGEQQTLVAQINNARADALDYLAFWKTFDLAANAAFSGTDAAALKNNPRLGDMERWADGWPVKRLVVETPRSVPAAGSQAAAPAKQASKPAARR